MPTQLPVFIINQHQFDKYAAAWSQHVSRHQELTPLFQQPDGSLLQAVRFSFDALQYLLSTVGARRVRAQFLLKEDEESGIKHFTLALYAVDAADGRISAYYLAQPVPPAPPRKPTEDSGKMLFTGVGADDPGTQIPNALVQTWVQNWRKASPITPAMFSSNYGPLLGYTFDMGDFLNSFFYASPSKIKELFVLFGLHQHYPAFPDCYTLKQTFGLVLRIHQLPDGSSQSVDDITAEDKDFLTNIHDIKSHAELVKAIQRQAATYGDPVDPDGQPFYDYSRPTPPY